MNLRYSRLLTSALALAACLVLLLHNPASAETYQWTDKDGNVGFADSLQKVPPEYRKSAKRLDETKDSTKTFQRVPTPPGRNNTMPPDRGPSDSYDSWRARLETARAELEELRAKRQKAQEEKDNLLFRRNQQSRPLDPDIEAKATSKINDLDQRTRDKEYEITTTIPDEARRAGVPAGVLSQ